MRFRRISLLAFLGSTLLCASGFTISNSGFETPDLTFGLGGCTGPISGPQYVYNPTGCGQAWSFQNNSGITRNGSAFGNPVGPDSSAQSAFLQDLGNFSQSITGLNIGSAYTVSFYAMQRTCCDASLGQTVSVQFDGVTLTFNSAADSFVHPDASGWILYTTDSFVASNSTGLLTFLGNYEGADATAFIDQIASTEVPEPGTFGFLGAALAGLVWLRKRKK